MYKVLLLARPDLFRIKAGDTIQIQSLKEAMESSGIQVDISLDLKPDPSSYDLVHCFNILRIDTILEQVNSILKYKKPIIITPIYWNMLEYLSVYKSDKIKLWQEKQKIRKKLLNYADLIIPNAYMEWELLKKDFAVEKPYKIIPNGVNSIFYQEKKNTRYGLLSVGRIHSRKNQLSLIEAIKGDNIPLIFIGDNNEPVYYKKCFEAAQNYPNIKFYRGVDQKNLVRFYCHSKVHILTSWYDTPGLVNLEAGLAACNLVTTERGSTREYFKDYAYYCDPSDIKDIRKQVLKAYHKNINNDLSQYIYKNYTWSKIGKDLLKIYSEFITQII